MFRKIIHFRAHITGLNPLFAAEGFGHYYPSATSTHRGARLENINNVKKNAYLASRRDAR